MRDPTVRTPRCGPHGADPTVRDPTAEGYHGVGPHCCSSVPPLSPGAGGSHGTRVGVGHLRAGQCARATGRGGKVLRSPSVPHRAPNPTPPPHLRTALPVNKPGRGPAHQLAGSGLSCRCRATEKPKRLPRVPSFSTVLAASKLKAEVPISCRQSHGTNSPGRDSPAMPAPHRTAPLRCGPPTALAVPAKRAPPPPNRRRADVTRRAYTSQHPPRGAAPAQANSGRSR